MCRLRSYFMILIALWLPLQAAAAWAMPFCRHAADQQAIQHHAVAAGCHHDQKQETASAPSLDCDNCEMCHLASAGYLLSLMNDVPVLPAHDVMVPQLAAVLPSHIGDPPQQPPRRSN